MIDREAVNSISAYKKWNEQICNCIENRGNFLDYFYFDKDRCCAVVKNEWGIYNDLDEVVYDGEVGEYLCQYMLGYGKKLVSMMTIKKEDFRQFIGIVYRILSHMIPNEKMLERMKNTKDIVEDGTVTIEYENEKEKLLLKDAYIYGIYKGNSLVYIGKTHRPVMLRIKEHIDGINDGVEGFYSRMNGMDNVHFKILFESHNGIIERELEYIEKTFIEFFKPIFNVEGVQTEYEFEEKPRSMNERFLDEKIDILISALKRVKEKEESLLEMLNFN